MKQLFYLLFVLLFWPPVLAQKGDTDTFKRARLYLSDFSIIKATKLVINENEISFLNADSRTPQKLSLSSVELIRVPRGSHVLEGALFGAGTLALTALLVDLQPDPLGIEREKDTNFYLGYTAVGAAIGALAGMLFPKWKLLYSNGKFVGSSGPLQMGLSSQHRSIGIKIKLTI